MVGQRPLKPLIGVRIPVPQPNNYATIKDMKKQIVVIHGGDTFETHGQYMDSLRNYEINIERYKTDKDDWKKPLRKKLGDGYEVILPIMPNKTNAQFEEWKIWMGKLTPFLNDNVILIGHSLGMILG